MTKFSTRKIPSPETAFHHSFSDKLQNIFKRIVGKESCFDIHSKILRHKDSLSHLNGKRLKNLIKLIGEIKSRKTILESRPIFLRVNTIPICNLSCPMCPIGQHKLGIKKMEKLEPTLSIEDYRRIIDKTSDWLLKVVLYDEGEPLLHPDMPDMIAYAAERNIATLVSTNLAMDMSDQRIKDVVYSGLSHLIVALDGMTQDIYSRYRIGGDISVVKDNLERLMSIKRGKKPFVELQFIRFGYNNHQFNAVRNYAQSLGIDRFTSFDSICHPDQREVRDNLNWQNPAKRRVLGCFDIYSVLDVNSGGMLYPCDHGEDYGMDPVGSIIENDLHTLWNSKALIELRESFQTGNLPKEICMNCHLESYLPYLLR